MKVLYVYTQVAEDVENVLDMHGVMYQVEYVPSSHGKSDHFGEVYISDVQNESVFSFFDETEFSHIQALLKESGVIFWDEVVVIERQDYQQQFEDAYPIVEVGRFCIVPPWKSQVVSRNTQLVITPSTGFGTGQSPTTQLCLEWISRCDLTNQHVLDFGSGSGILAIAAAKCGARKVVALEIDPDACENAKKQIELNECIDTVDVVQVENSQYDMLLMNVTAPILFTFFDQVWERIQIQGYLSGIQASEYESVYQFLLERNITYTTDEKAGWYGFEVRK